MKTSRRFSDRSKFNSECWRSPLFCGLLFLSLSSALTATAQQEVLNFPLDQGVSAFCSQGPGQGSTHRSQHTRHAIDLAAPLGTRVIAAASGTAHAFFASPDPDFFDPECPRATSRGFGNFVTVDHGNGQFSLYSHLEQIAPGIDGEQVVGGTTVLGTVDSTGYSCGNHLHFSLHAGDALNLVGSTSLPFSLRVMDVRAGNVVTLSTDELACGGPGFGKFYASAPTSDPPPVDFWIRTNGPDLTQSTAVVSLAVDSSGTLYAPTNQGCVSASTLGVLRTFDNGETWSAVNDGLESTNITALSVSPDDTVFAATDAGIFSLHEGDGSWRATGLARGPLGLTDLVATRLTVLASAGCGCTGVYRSTDGGTFWRSSNGGILAGHLCMQSLATDTQGVLLYGGSGTNGVYRSTNQGASWQALTAGQPPHKVREVTVSPSGDVFAATLSLGVFRYLFDDDRWLPASNGLPDVRLESISAAPSGLLLVGTVGLGIFVSTDNGESWTELNAGIDPEDLRFTVGAFAFDADGFAYAAVGSVVYRSVVPVTSATLPN